MNYLRSMIKNSLFFIFWIWLEVLSFMAFKTNKWNDGNFFVFGMLVPIGLFIIFSNMLVLNIHLIKALKSKKKEINEGLNENKEVNKNCLLG